MDQKGAGRKKFKGTLKYMLKFNASKCHLKVNLRFKCNEHSSYIKYNNNNWTLLIVYLE